MEAKWFHSGILKKFQMTSNLLYRTVWEVSQKSIIDMAADQRCLHMSKSKHEYSYARCKFWKTNIYAFPCLEIRIKKQVFTI